LDKYSIKIPNISDKLLIKKNIYKKNIKNQKIYLINTRNEEIVNFIFFLQIYVKSYICLYVQHTLYFKYVCTDEKKNGIEGKGTVKRKVNQKLTY